MKLTTHRGTAILTGVVAIALMTSVGAWAVPRSFSDVPTTHLFYEEIQDVSDACVAGGYLDGTYRPTEPVSRQTMAAFLSRAMSRTAQGTDAGEPNPRFGAEPATSGPWLTVATVSVTTPELPGDCQIPVHLDSFVTVLSSDPLSSTCHVGNPYCAAEAALFAGDTEGERASTRVKTDHWGDSLSPTQVFLQAENTTVTYALRVRGFNVQEDGLFVTHRNIVATTHPTQATGPT